MKKAWNFLYAVAGLVVLGMVTLGVVTAFRAINEGAVPGALARTPQGYPPPQVTIPIPTPLPNIEPPTPTSPPVPTPLPTPVVTPIPTSRLPIISSPTGQVAELYTIIFRDGNVLRSIKNDGADEHGLLDIHAQLPLFLAGDKVNIRTWGSPSPDGKQLALVLSNVETLESLAKGDSPKFSIYLLDLSTVNLRLLVQDGVDPVWSPDSTRIAYRNTHTPSLWIVDVIAGTTREIFSANQTEGDDYRVGSFAWSPDGKEVAFVRSFSDTGSGEIWIADVAGDGKALQLLLMESQAGNLNWSPTGDQILFLSYLGERLTPDTLINLWTVDVKTGIRHQITRNFFVGGGIPIWSPDGSWIAFSGVNSLEGETPPYDLWLVARDGSDVKRLTSDPADDLYISWVSSANKLVFQKAGAGIWELDLADNKTKQIYPVDVSYLVAR